MKTEVKVPEVGESVREALLSQWYRSDGEFVRKGDLLFVIETDKVTLEVAAEADGVLSILAADGTTVPVGSVVASIEIQKSLTGPRAQPLPSAREEAAAPQTLGREADDHERRGEIPPSLDGNAGELETPTIPSLDGRGRGRVEASDVRHPHPTSPVEGEELNSTSLTSSIEGEKSPSPTSSGLNVAPSATHLALERGVELAKVHGTGPAGRITRGDVLLHLEESPVPGSEKPPGKGPVAPPTARVTPAAAPPAAGPPPVRSEQTTRKPMSPIRQRIAQRLIEARQTTAMLTTFNEIDMSHVLAIRAQFKDAFKAKYGVNLGIMSFFIKASVTALMEYPAVNSFIEGQEILTHHYYHIGVAIGGGRGLVVPVIRHVDQLSHALLEQAIAEYVRKVQENRLTVADLEGGTFTISNGGIYGSLLSTPILNIPQSGVLGMHKIEDRPVAIAGQVVVRPMMYVALTYDHRIIDGREAVSFLKRIKECVEDPERTLLEI